MGGCEAMIFILNPKILLVLTYRGIGSLTKGNQLGHKFSITWKLKKQSHTSYSSQ